MDLWIDDDNHTKQCRMRGDTRNPRGGTQGKPLDLTITFLDVNQPVTVQPPPSEDAADIATLADEAQTS